MIGILLIQNCTLVKAGETSEVDENKQYVDIEKGSGIVLSEQTYDEWSLSWESIGFFDTLVDAKNKEHEVAYEYEDGKRISKSYDGILTNYVYDEYGRLVVETTGDEKRIYLYEEDVMVGYEINGEKYYYIYSGNIITGIEKNGEMLIEYKYDFDVLCDEIIYTDDIYAISNPFRYMNYYLDVETGWYYLGRYYDAKNKRFVDGISEDTARELQDELPLYELLAKTYTNGVNIQSNQSISPETAVARVIKLESHLYTDDQLCVAWVIKNRMNGTRTAFEVVSEPGQFTTYNSNEYNNFAAYAVGPLWVNACNLAWNLTYNQPIQSAPMNYNNQIYFSSVNTCLSGSYNSGNNTLVFHNYDDSTHSCTVVTYSNMWLIPLNFSENANLSFQSVLIKYSGGGYNVYCDKTFVPCSVH